MKNVLAAAIGALLVAGAIAANAATMAPRAHEAVTVPVTANSAPPAHTNKVAPWNVDLSHQTGGSR